MLHTYNKKDLIMMPEWAEHFKSHNKTPEEGMEAKFYGK